MLTMNQTPLEDNKVIWFIKITLDSEELYLTDKINGIILTNSYDGNSTAQSINSNEIYESCNFSAGAVLPSVPSLTLEIPRDNNNSFFEDFQNAIYPNTTDYLISRIVDIGIGWEGIIDETEITWLYEFYIQDINVSYDRMTFNLLGFDDFNVQIPRHIVQKENANANFYFPNADNQNIGLPLPLLYGEFITYDFRYNNVNLAYTICTNKNLFEYYYASHVIKQDISDITFLSVSSVQYLIALLEYKEGLQNYLELLPAEGECINSHSGSYIRILKESFTLGDVLSGNILLNILKPYNDTNYADIDLLNNYPRQEITLDKGELLAVQLNLEGYDNDLGLLSSLNPADIQWRVIYQSDGAYTVNIDMAYNNKNIGYSTAQTDSTNLTGINWKAALFNMAQDTTAKDDNNLPYKLEELLSYGFVIENTSSSTSQLINISEVCLIIKNITVARLKERLKSIKMSYAKVPQVQIKITRL